MEQKIQIFVAVNFLIIGLSHIFYFRLWSRLFLKLHELGRTGPFVHGMITLFGGSMVISFHNVWTGPAMIVTMAGWVYVIKAAVVFLVPGLGFRSLSLIKKGNEKNLAVAGVVLTIIGVTGLYCALSP